MSYKPFRDPADRNQGQYILDHVKRLGPLYFQLKKDKALHLLRDSTCKATVFMTMEDRLEDDFGSTMFAEVTYTGQIAIRMFSSPPPFKRTVLAPPGDLAPAASTWS